MDWIAGVVALLVPPPLAARLVFLAVARTMGSGHRSYIGVPAITTVTGLKERAVRSSLAWLEKHGALEDLGPAPGFRADRAPRVRRFTTYVYNAAGAANRAASWQARGASTCTPLESTGGAQ